MFFREFLDFFQITGDVVNIDSISSDTLFDGILVFLTSSGITDDT